MQWNISLMVALCDASRYARLMLLVSSKLVVFVVTRVLTMARDRCLPIGDVSDPMRWVQMAALFSHTGTQTSMCRTSGCRWV